MIFVLNLELFLINTTNWGFATISKIQKRRLHLKEMHDFC